MTRNVTSAGSKTTVTEVESPKENKRISKVDEGVVTETVTQFAGSAVQAQDAPTKAEADVKEPDSSVAPQTSNAAETGDAAEPATRPEDGSATNDKAPAASTQEAPAPATASLEKNAATSHTFIENLKEHISEETNPAPLQESGRANDEPIKSSQDDAQGKTPAASSSESPAHTPGSLEKSGAANDTLIQDTKEYAKQDGNSGLLQESGRANDELIKSGQDYAQDKPPAAGSSESPAHTPGALEKSGAANDKLIQDTKEYAKQDSNPDRLQESGRATDELIKASQDYAQGKTPAASTSKPPAHTPGALEKIGAANDKFIQTTTDYAKQDSNPGRLAEAGARVDDFMAMCNAYANGESTSTPPPSAGGGTTQPVGADHSHAPTQSQGPVIECTTGQDFVNPSHTPIRTVSAPTHHPISLELRSALNHLNALMDGVEQMVQMQQAMEMLQMRQAMAMMQMRMATQMPEASHGGHHVGHGSGNHIHSTHVQPSSALLAANHALKAIGMEIGGALGLLSKIMSKMMGSFEMPKDPPRLAHMKSAAQFAFEPIIDDLKSKLGMIEHMLSKQIHMHQQKHLHIGMHTVARPMLPDASRTALASIGTDIKITMRKIDKLVERMDVGAASGAATVMRPVLQKMEGLAKA